MKYAIQVSYYMYNSETDTEYEQWMYLGIKGEHRIFVFDFNVEERTKLFDSAKEAGEYIDKFFGLDKIEQRCSFNTVRLVEVEV